MFARSKYQRIVEHTKRFRVIFVEASGDVCRERLLDRRYNIVTGSKHDLSTKSHLNERDCKLGIHPRDYRLIVERDVNIFFLILLTGEDEITRRLY